MPCAQALNQIADMDGLVVIGEGERDQAPMLYIGEKVGSGTGQKIDIALDPLEGTTLCAKAMPNAIGGDRHGRARQPACMRPTPIWTRSPSAAAYPKGTVDLDLPAGREHRGSWPKPRAWRRPISPPASSTARAMPS